VAWVPRRSNGNGMKGSYRYQVVGLCHL